LWALLDLKGLLKGSFSFPGLLSCTVLLIGLVSGRSLFFWTPFFGTPFHTVSCRTLQHMQHNATLRTPYYIVRCNTLQHTATQCNTQQHTATHCNTLQHTAMHCNVLQRTAAQCNTLPHLAAHCNTLTHYNTPENRQSAWKSLYWVATISRLLKIIGLFCKKAL